MPTADVIDGLRELGLRATKDALSAWLTHATKSKASPLETCEQLIRLERKERDARNLARRTRQATLGKFKPLDAFDWNHPRVIDRQLYEQLHGLEFLDA